MDNGVIVLAGQQVGLAIDGGVNLAAHHGGVAVGGAAGVGHGDSVQPLAHQEGGKG